MRVYINLVLTSQVQARSTIFDNSTPEVDAQQVFKSTFKALINEDYSVGIDIERYQGVLEHVTKIRFFSGHRDIHASKQFKFKHGKDKRIQQQNFSEQHRHENWFK